MLRITSLNLNGIRSAYNKGLLEWLKSHQADILCLQELKAHLADIHQDYQHPLDYTGHFCAAEKKGYSGVGIYLKQQPERVLTGIDCPEFDQEGRVIRADWSNLTVVSAYLPSGSSGPERQEAKFRFLAKFGPWLQALMDDHKKTKREYVICADWNIAHKEIDLKNWKSNQKNSGFTPEERAWVTHTLEEIGFIDVFRALDPSPDQYTWWSNRGQAWAKNVGWRLDYQLATPGIASLARSTSIYKDERFSDHAPFTIDYDFTLGAKI